MTARLGRWAAGPPHDRAAGRQDCHMTAWLGDWAAGPPHDRVAGRLGGRVNASSEVSGSLLPDTLAGASAT